MGTKKHLPLKKRFIKQKTPSESQREHQQKCDTYDQINKRRKKKRS